MSDIRLDDISPELTKYCRAASESARWLAATKAAIFAAETTGLDDPLVHEAIQRARQRRSLELDAHEALKKFVERLDGQYLDLKEAWEADETDEDDWIQAFRRARAANAAAYLFEYDSFKAVTECIYEALAATDDLNRLRAIIVGALVDAESGPAELA